MTHIRSTTYGETRLRLLRVLHRGDRHDPKDVIVSLRLEGGDALPAEPLKNAVYRVARTPKFPEVETFAMAIAEAVLTQFPQVTLARVEVSELAWSRLEIGGKAHGQAFAPGSGERRAAMVGRNGERTSVTAGIGDLVIMRTCGFGNPHATPAARELQPEGVQPLVIAALSVKWSYGPGDIAFATFRQGVRAAVVENFVWHASDSLQHTLSGIGEVILDTYAEITAVTLTAEERPYRPADLLSIDSDHLYVARDEPLGVVEVTIDRADRPGRSTSAPST
jgi:urate oxidase